jgi:endonuclease YncB( thermonuclease family)
VKVQKLIVSTLLTIILVFVHSGILAYADFTGSVVSVLDGDTIEVLRNQHPECIRLSNM